MADILRVTTPLINKNQAPELKRPIDPTAQFPLTDITRVAKPNSQSDILSQNNGLIQQEDTSALLLKLLKDPSVTVNFLKSISSMEALIRLLPANNNPFTQEIERMFGQLLVPSDEMAGEMKKQENASTFFKGDLFEFLRAQLKQNPNQSELRSASVSFLKALTLFYTQREALGSVANSLKFLSDALFSSKTLSQQLADLAARFRGENAQSQFGQLRQETLELLRKVEDSILFTDKLDKTVKMAIYNLSRYNDNGDFLQESVSRLLSQLRGDAAKELFLTSLERFIQDSRQPGQREPSAMDVLTQILTRQAASEEVMALNGERMETIIHSLLSSPCNFTPLLHFVLPVQYEDLRSFAEVWINPNGEEDDRDRPNDARQSIHMLLSFEIDSIGRFEVELFARDQNIDLALYCPPAYHGVYNAIKKNFRECAADTGYRMGDVRVERLERPRSLMDVFRSLPYKRTGVDVRI